MVKKEKPPAIVMTDGKREIIRQLLREYNIQTAQDIQEALKDLLSGTMNAPTRINPSVSIPATATSTSRFLKTGNRPSRRKLFPNGKRIFPALTISMYGRGLSTRQISDTIEELYGFEVSDDFVSDVTDKILPQIHEWQTRPLEEVYPVMFVDATHYSVRDNGVVRKLATYIILAINCDGRKEVLSIEIGENESALARHFEFSQVRGD